MKVKKDHLNRDVDEAKGGEMMVAMLVTMALQMMMIKWRPVRIWTVQLCTNLLVKLMGCWSDGRRIIEGL